MSAPPSPRVEEVFDDAENRRGAASEFGGFTPQPELTLEQRLEQAQAENRRLEEFIVQPELTLEQRLEQAQAENRRLEQERQLAELEARNHALRNATSPSTPRGIPGSPPAVAPLMAPPIKAKTIRPEKMRAYHGKSEGEHQRWFRECETKYLNSPEYFTTDQAKIAWCMLSLEGDPASQWYSEFKKKGLEGYTYERFQVFLLNLIIDPANRRLLAYERWEEAKQQPNQKVSVFKAYLEEVEAQIPEFSEGHKANFFLAKLKPELKGKILSTGNVPTQREDILAQAIMQERVLERARQGGGSHSHAKSSGGPSVDKPKDKSLDSRISKPNSAPKGGAKSAHPRGEKGKRKADEFNPEHKDDTCYHCGKKGHRKPACPDIDRPPAASVAAVAAKNDQASQPPHKRGKKNDQ